MIYKATLFHPELFYFKNQSLFLLNSDYFKSFLTYPGGMSDYIANFIFQFYAIQSIGPFISSLLLICILSSILAVFSKIKSVPYQFILAWIPFGIMLLIQNSYAFYITIHIQLILALLCFYLYLLVQSMPFRLGCFLVAGAFLYPVLGGLFFLFFTGMVVVFEICFGHGKTRILFILIGISTGLLYPYISSRYVFFMELKNAYFQFLPDSHVFIDTVWLYVGLLSLCLLIAIHKWMPFEFPKSGFYKWLTRFQVPIFLIGCFLILAFSQDRKEENSLKIAKWAEEGKWNEILIETGSVTRDEMVDHFDVEFLNNFNRLRACANTNQLLNRLFDQQQFLGTEGLFINKELGANITLPTSALFFDLGHMQAAKMYCYEALTSYPYDPRIYKRLVLIHLINREYGAADKYIKVLQRDLLHRNWADHYAAYVGRPALSETDSLFVEKRACIPQKQFFMQIDSPQADLLELLKANPHNKMAFDYLMAYYLLSNDMDAIVEKLHQFPEFGYETLPKHIEEALLIHRFLHRDLWQKREFLRTVPISPATFERFDRYNKLVFKHGNNPETLTKMMPDYLKQTYWFYLTYTSQESNMIHLKKIGKHAKS